MSAVDATRERFSHAGSRWLGGRAARRARDRSLGFCRRNFSEHALRHRGDPGQLRIAGWNYFLRRFSALAATARNGIRAFAVMLGRSRGRIALLRPTPHGRGRVLCNPGWTRRRFRHFDFWPLSTGANRRGGISAVHCYFGSETWPRGILWRADHGSWFSRVDSERLDGFLPAGRADCDRDFFRRTLHVHNPVSVRAAAAGAPAARLDF